MGSADPFHGQAMDDVVGSVRENAESRECGQRGRKVCLQGFCYGRGWRDSKAVSCAVLTEWNLAAWEVLSHRAQNRTQAELGKQKQRDSKELASKNEKLKAAKINHES